MHHALEIPEILLIIFKYVFFPPSCLSQFSNILSSNQHNADMFALARTCHAFKEPALDILWSVLGNLSAIGRCVPDAYHGSLVNMPFMFYRTLTQEEHRILRSYTRRIRVIRDFDSGLGLDSVPENFFGQDLLFPYLRELNFYVMHGISPWLRNQHIPSLDSINISSFPVRGPRFIRDCIAPLSEFYPNLTKITLVGSEIGISSKPRHGPSTSSAYTWPWKDLRVLDCPDFKLEIADLKQLSRLPALIKLTFAFSNAEDIVAALSTERLVLAFPSLKDLKFSYRTRSLELTTRFLAQVKLPAMEQLVVHVDRCLAKDIEPFLSAVQAACNNGSINLLRSVRLTDVSTLKIFNNILLPQSELQRLHNWASQRRLTLEDLRPSMAFSNIRHVELDVAARIHLTDGALLELASTWPFLEHLSINEGTGWNCPGSVDGWITLDGLHQVLVRCPLLSHVGLVIHMPDEAATLSVPTTNLNSRPHLRRTFYINVMDSIVGILSIPVAAAFLAAVVGPYDDFELKAWCALSGQIYSDGTAVVNRGRWKLVRCVVDEILGRFSGGN